MQAGHDLFVTTAAKSTVVVEKILVQYLQILLQNTQKIDANALQKNALKDIKDQATYEPCTITVYQ